MSTVAAVLLPLSGSPLQPGTTYASAPLAIVDPALAAAMIGAAAPLPVIVTFHKSSALGPNDVAVLRQVGIARGLTFEALPMAGVLATPSQIQALAARPEIRSIYANAPLTLYNQEARELTGVCRVQESSDVTAANGGLPVAGHGVTVLVNDSGVDGTHPDLAYGSHLVENTLGSTNLHAYDELLPVTYLEGVVNTDTNSGHGTHCAGSVGGSGAASGGLYAGVAPAADLVGYGSGGALLVLDGIGGFDYALSRQDELGIDVITNSWGSSGDFDPEHPINVASYLAYKNDITVLFAAGNEGPGEDTHNPYAKAPWVISVAAGDKRGALAGFSSRGAPGGGGTFALDGQTWAWEDRPTVAAPGVAIISTRAIAPVSSLAAQQDIEVLDPTHLPYYTHMDGTSMATPHVAGVVALLLDADPSLTPDDVKAILQDTATNMPGHEPWEVGAGYLNAYAAVDEALRAPGYGSTVNLGADFHSDVAVAVTTSSFTVTYDPVLTQSNAVPFGVPAGTTELVARIDAVGAEELTGNPVNLVLIAPDGTEHGSGVSLLFPLEPRRTVSVTGPAPGAWKLEIRGMRGAEQNPLGLALPEQIDGTLKLKAAGPTSGLGDIAGHPGESAIKVAVSERLVDGFANGLFKPDQVLTRLQLAEYLTRGAGVRQALPFGGWASFSDVGSSALPFVEAVTAQGAALRDRSQADDGVMRPSGPGTFSPHAAVTRAELAYALVQSLGLQAEAEALLGEPLTVQYGDDRLPIEDEAVVPADLRGHVQLALDLGLLNASFTMTQGALDLWPTVHASFKPAKSVTRAAYAAAATRFFSAFLAP